MYFCRHMSEGNNSVPFGSDVYTSSATATLIQVFDVTLNVSQARDTGMLSAEAQTSSLGVNTHIFGISFRRALSS